MAGTIRPDLGRNIQHPLAGPRTDAQKQEAFGKYLKAIPYCDFESIPVGVMREIEAIDIAVRPEFRFFKKGIQKKDLLKIFNGYFLADQATQNITGPLFKRAFGVAIKDACRFDTIAAQEYVTDHPDETPKWIAEVKANIKQDKKGDPVPMREVKPNDLYLPDNFLLNRRKEVGNGLTAKVFIEGDPIERQLFDDLANLVRNKLANDEMLDDTEFRYVLDLLKQTRDLSTMMACLDVRILSEEQHSYLVKSGMMHNNPSQHENNERISIQRVYQNISELKTDQGLNQAEKEELVDKIKFDIVREGYFPHRYIANIYNELSEINKTVNAPVNLTEFLDYLESFQDPVFDNPENYISSEVKLIIHDLDQVFNTREAIQASVTTYAIPAGQIPIVMATLAAGARDDLALAGNMNLPVYYKCYYDNNSLLVFPHTRQVNFFEGPGTFLVYNDNNHRSFGSILSISVLREKGHLTDAMFFNAISTIHNVYNNLADLRQKRFKTLFSTIQTFRAVFIFSNLYILGENLNDFVHAVRSKLHGYIDITNDTLNLIHEFAIGTLNAAQITDLIIICALEYGDSNTGFYFVDHGDALQYIDLLRQAWKISAMKDEVAYRDAIQTLTSNVYWDDFANLLYQGRIMGTCFVYDILKIGIMGPGCYRIETGNEEYDRLVKENAAQLAHANIAYFAYINTHRFGFPGLGLRKIEHIDNLQDWYFSNKRDYSDSNNHGVFLNQFGKSVRSKKQKEETKKKAKKVLARKGKKKKMEEVKVPDVVANATAPQLIAHSIQYYKKYFLSFRRLKETFVAICREGGEARTFERESKPNNILTESKVMKGLDGTWSVHALKRVLLRYNIHVFSSSLHFDSELSAARKFGIKCNIGMLFDCGIENLYSFGVLPPLHIDLNPVEYKSRWSELTNRIDNIRMGKDSVRVSVKSTPLYKTSSTGIFTMQGKKDGLNTGDVIEIRIKPLKTVESVFSKLPGIKNIMNQYFDDMEALYLLTGNVEYLLLRSEEESAYLKMLWNDPSCSMYRETAKALHQNSLIERISTKAGLRAFKDMQYLMSGLDHMKFSNGTFKVEVESGDDIVNALAFKEFGNDLKMERFQTERSKEMRYLKSETIADGILDDILNPGLELIPNNDKVAFKRKLITNSVYPQIEIRAQEVNDGTIKRISEERALIKDAEGSLISVNATKAMLSILEKVFQIQNLQTMNVGELRQSLTIIMNNLGGGVINEKKRKLIKSAFEKLEGFEDNEHINDYSSYKRPDIYKPMYTINPKKNNN